VALPGVPAGAHKRLGALRLRAGDAPGALAAVLRARELAPADPAAHLNALPLLAEAGNATAAHESLAAAHVSRFLSAPLYFMETSFARD